MDRKNASVIFWTIAVVVVLLDLWSKAKAFSYLQVHFALAADGSLEFLPAPAVEIFPGFALEASVNFGAFNGWFAGMPWALLAVSAIAPLVTYAIVLKATARSKLLVVSLSLIAGGALGNLWDRAVYGAVRDFIKFYVTIDGRDHVWPNFNIADSAIVVGVLIILFLELRPASGATDGTESPPSPATEEEPQTPAPASEDAQPTPPPPASDR